VVHAVLNSLIISRLIISCITASRSADGASGRAAELLLLNGVQVVCYASNTGCEFRHGGFQNMVRVSPHELKLTQLR